MPQATQHKPTASILVQPWKSFMAAEYKDSAQKKDTITATIRLRENSSGLERDMLLKFEAQEDLPSAAARGSPRPHHSSGPTHPPMDQEPDHTGINCDGLEGLRHDSPPRTQAEDGGSQEQQHQMAAMDTMREARDNDGKGERGEGRANCHHQDGGPEPGSDRSHATNDKGNVNEDDDDEEPRPANGGSGIHKLAIRFMGI
ncbi:hypothetical protein VE03_08553 [Pseudogymnoascus sp. 23342-1-I1]|nr:hypothetical protein VE03_08553 [Pseudogymnoascus sp. 23342-1-I1]